MRAAKTSSAPRLPNVQSALRPSQPGTGSRGSAAAGVTASTADVYGSGSKHRCTATARLSVQCAATNAAPAKRLHPVHNFTQRKKVIAHESAIHMLMLLHADAFPDHIPRLCEFLMQHETSTKRTHAPSLRRRALGRLARRVIQDGRSKHGGRSELGLRFQKECSARVGRAHVCARTCILIELRHRMSHRSQSHSPARTAARGPSPRGLFGHGTWVFHFGPRHGPWSHTHAHTA